MARQRQLEGKAAVVTGGGRGIGAAIAESLARQGCRVAVGDLDGDLAAKVVAGFGPPAWSARLDVTDSKQFTRFLDEAEERLGPLDILVNNAGIMPVGPFLDEDISSTQRQLSINLRAVIHGSREAVRRMRTRGSGHIVNVASSAGRGAVPGASTYAATKWGVVGFSESIRMELRGTGIDVSWILPGIVRTELTDGLPDNPAVKTVTPQVVADAVVDVLRRPRAEVFVPPVMGHISRILGMLPRSTRDWFQHALKADDNMLKAAQAPERRTYEERAASSAPSAQLPERSENRDEER